MYKVEHFDINPHLILGIRRITIGFNNFRYMKEVNPITNQLLKHNLYIKLFNRVISF